MTWEDLFRDIVTLTGGRSAEEFIFHTRTTGASNDIERATKMARAMVTRFGMTDEFDFMALETVNNQYLGGDASLAAAPNTAAEIDQKVRGILRKAHETALEILRTHEQEMHAIAGFLLDRETITGDEFMQVLNESLVVNGREPLHPEEPKEDGAQAAEPAAAEALNQSSAPEEGECRES